MNPTMLIVVPTYRHFEYATRAVTSALEKTRTFDPYVLVVDDASPEALELDESYLSFRYTVNSLVDHDRVSYHQYPENGGLTRSWNLGLRHAREHGHDACCVTNSDVVFAPGWDRDVFAGLDYHKLDLVGPVTNAPGTNAEQYVGRYSVVYDADRKDDAAHFDEVQRELHRHQRGRYKSTTLNGFCMAAFTKTWWANAFDGEHAFRPRNDVNSKGQPNPTPLMTLNEYELQARWHARGLKTAACLSSYVFHYRAVSRGDRHKKGDWVRVKREGV